LVSFQARYNMSQLLLDNAIVRETNILQPGKFARTILGLWVDAERMPRRNPLLHNSSLKSPTFSSRPCTSCSSVHNAQRGVQVYRCTAQYLSHDCSRGVSAAKVLIYSIMFRIKPGIYCQAGWGSPLENTMSRCCAAICSIASSGVALLGGKRAVSIGRISRTALPRGWHGMRAVLVQLISILSFPISALPQLVT
jgi:hypothetical protein